MNTNSTYTKVRSHSGRLAFVSASCNLHLLETLIVLKADPLTAMIALASLHANIFVSVDNPIPPEAKPFIISRVDGL
jgi:hypothetical protein